MQDEKPTRGKHAHTTSLVALDREQLDTIARVIPGGASNILDIYPLSPLQEGILFHRLLDEERDSYVLSTLFELDAGRIDALHAALQRVVDSHEALRAAVLWEDLPRPVQVVQRHALLPLQQLTLSPDHDALSQIRERMRPGRTPFEVRRAPLAQLSYVADGNDGKCYALFQVHHLVCDHQSLQTIVAEALAVLAGTEYEPPKPSAYRAYVAHALAHARLDDAQTYFRQALGDFDEPSAPFGLTDVHADGSAIEDVRGELDPEIASSARAVARSAGVSVARFFHAAWALVVAHTSGKEDVVFGSVVLARALRGAKVRRTLGMAVNTLPLRIRVSETSAKELVEQTHLRLTELLRHEHAPLTLAQRCSGTGAGSPLFTTIFNYRHSAGSAEISQSSAAGVRVLARGEAWSNYPLALTVDDTGESFVLTVQSDRRVDPQRVIGYMQTAVQSLARALEHAPHTPALSLSIVPEEERRLVVEDFNATCMEFPREQLVHQLVETQATLRPKATAVVCADRQLTYAQLNHRADQLARTLCSLGVGPGSRVAVYMERSTDLVAALLGTLKAGGAYVPVDISYPAERIAYMLSDSSPVAILTQAALAHGLPASGIPVVMVDTLEKAPDKFDSGESTLAPGPADLAYVIYTSGSTGQPKGVLVEHRGLANLVHWHRVSFGLNESTRSSCIAAIGFDASTWEIWPPLCTGGTLVVSPPTLVGDVEKLVEWWAQQELDISFLPTPLAELAFSRNLSCNTLRALLVGGDRLRHRPAAPSFALINNYGPTETSVVATSGLIHDDDRSMHIGRPIANTQIYILDRHRRPVPLGVAGELYIGGAGLARGYLNRPEQTQQQFVENPFSTDPQARLYKTGDLGRWRRDGTIEYLGRNDHQVKIRGFRIETAEIEARLAQHPQVRDAVVIAREPVIGQKHLVAYVVPVATTETPTAAELRAHLRLTLPDYMVPSAFATLERLPLTANGKLDLKALPVPERSAYASREYMAPQGRTEQVIAQIWQEVLHVEQVGRNDNFFELGGHSLLIVQMMQRLHRAGITAEVRDVFARPTLAEVAAASHPLFEQAAVPLNLIPPGCERIAPDMLPLIELDQQQIARIVAAAPGGTRNLQDIYPLAPLQEGILFHYLLQDEGPDVYVVPTLFALRDRARVDHLIAGLQAVIDRHDILRTALLWEQLPRPVQIVLRRANLPVEHVELDPDADALPQVQTWLKPEDQRLDLRQAPLLRLRVAADPRSSQWYALLQLHHIAGDATSLGIIIEEVKAHVEGQMHKLPVEVPYRNHVAQALAYTATPAAQTFFRGKLADLEEPTAPFGIMDVHENGTRTEEACQALEPQLSASIRAQARRLSVSAATLFHAAWALVVGATSNRQDVVFGTVLLGRLQGHAGSQHILGMLINTLPLRLRLRDVSAIELVRQTHRELLELLAHEPASLSLAQRCSGIPASAPLFTALLNYRHNARLPEAGWFGIEGIEVLASRGLTNYPIVLSVDDRGSDFALTAQTQRGLDPRRLVSYLQTAMESLLVALEQAPQCSALELNVLSVEEQTRIAAFNSTDRPYGEELLVHELFEAQVRRAPTTAAIVYSDRSLTYGELNRHANQLARQLRVEGVSAGTLVGVCVERVPEMVIALLATLKAGAAYVPLDPKYPAERLQYMLDDARPQVVLTQVSLQGMLPATGARIVQLEPTLQAVADSRADDLTPAQIDCSPHHPVYVIYTSGSTGRPKGTVMSHRAMVNLLGWHREDPYLSRPARVLQFAALSFDVAFQDTFSTLCTGGTLVLLDDWMRRDAQALVNLLRKQSIERMFIPPLLLQSLAEYFCTTGIAPDGIKDVITAGEQLRVSPQIVRLFEHCAGARLHNHYGPTETHVVTALTLDGPPQQWPTLPSIGRPIANTRIHILSAQGRPVPLGVAGEIYIAGANVALGYLHREDLTNQRFVPDLDPASKRRMYKSGDLGYWREDGTIEYLGRNDDQIKIRGFRVELGEIEAQLARHEGVNEVAVAARADVAGQQRLVAYIVAHARSQARSNFVDSLREHLKGLLPEHMLPSAFVMLQQLPVTPSGKLDRRALPAPEIGANPSRIYQPPQGEIETSIARIWREVLQLSQVGRTDDFFELGGHSLLVLRMLLKINHSLNDSLSVADIYQNPSVQTLAARIANGSVAEQDVDLSREAVLDPHHILCRIPERHVLLTGATGFVGRFVLAELLQRTQATVHCLVRGRSEQEAATRVRDTLAQWDLWQEEFEHRIVAIPGDLRQARLGIDEASYRALERDVDSIYHCGTSMNHLETYAMAKAANVDSTKELLTLATQGRPKLINYVSTTAVFSNFAPGTPRVVDETTPIANERHSAASGYVASKWVAEHMFLTAHERGIPCNVFRVGLVWADTQRGRFDELQWVYRLLKTALLSGMGIRAHHLPMVPVPVDHVATAITHLARRHANGGGIFHICGRELRIGGLFEACNQVLGTSLDLLPYYDWICELKRLHEAGYALPAVPLMQYAFAMDRATFENHLRTRATANIRIDDTLTRQQLEIAGIRAPALDHRLLEQTLLDMMQRDIDLQGSMASSAASAEATSYEHAQPTMRREM